MVDDRVVPTTRQRRGSWPAVNERQRERGRVGSGAVWPVGYSSDVRSPFAVVDSAVVVGGTVVFEFRVERSHRARQATTRRYDITFLVGLGTLDANGLSRSEDVIVGSA